MDVGDERRHADVGHDGLPTSDAILEFEHLWIVEGSDLVGSMPDQQRRRRQASQIGAIGSVDREQEPSPLSAASDDDAFGPRGHRRYVPRGELATYEIDVMACATQHGEVAGPTGSRASPSRDRRATAQQSLDLRGDIGGDGFAGRADVEVAASSASDIDVGGEAVNRQRGTGAVES